MDWTTLRVAEWLPDQPDFESPGATVANNCYADARAYKPLRQPEDYSAVIPTGNEDYLRGGIAMKDANNSARVYAGNAGALYELSATGWDDISVAGAYSGTSTDNVWHFAKYTPSLLIATNYMNAPQKIVPGSNAVALGGSPPRAKYVALVRDFVVLGFINDGTQQPNVVAWSGFNDAEYWSSTTDMTRQSDRQELFEGGWITGLLEVSGRGLVLQEQAVHLMSYVGPPVIFSFERVMTGTGCLIPGSAIAHRDRAYWWSGSDIWQWAGGELTAIGTERVAETLYADLDDTNKGRVTACVDPQNNLVIWSYPGVGNIGGQPNKLLIYAWDVNRFSSADLETDGLFRYLAPGYSLEQLDNINTSIDALTTSLDDDLWKGGQESLALFTADRKLATLSGPPMTATIETAELRSAPGRHTELMNTRPLHEGGSAKIAIGTRELQSQSPTWTSAQDVNQYGEANIRINARFMRARLTMSGNWSQAIGVDAYVRPSGER